MNKPIPPHFTRKSSKTSSLKIRILPKVRQGYFSFTCLHCNQISANQKHSSYSSLVPPLNSRNARHKHSCPDRPSVTSDQGRQYRLLHLETWKSSSLPVNSVHVKVLTRDAVKSQLYFSAITLRHTLQNIS